MLKSRAESTTQKYVNEIQKFFVWCKRKQVKLMVPFTSSVLAIYLLELKKTNKSACSLVLVHAALKWLHTFCPLEGPNPLDNGFCKNILEAAKRSREVPIKKKKPLSSTMLKQIIDRYAGDGASLKDLRVAAICSIGFAGFLRYNELSNLKPEHIAFHKDFIKIFIPKSKTDIYREGNYVYISRTQTKYCPVLIIEKYMKVANVEVTSDLPLFRCLTKKKRGYALRNNKLSYTRYREIFKDCISSLGFETKDFGLHSLRAGGITAAVATDPSISERLLKLHGRWKSDIAKDMYVLETEENRLRVSRSLGI